MSAVVQEIKAIINRVSASNYVKRIDVTELSSNDFDYKVVIKNKKNKTRVLIALESNIYFNKSFNIQAIKGIEDGLSLLDIEENTHRIVIKAE